MCKLQVEKAPSDFPPPLLWEMVVGIGAGWFGTGAQTAAGGGTPVSALTLDEGLYNLNRRSCLQNPPVEECGLFCAKKFLVPPAERGNTGTSPSPTSPPDPPEWAGRKIVCTL